MRSAALPALTVFALATLVTTSVAAQASDAAVHVIVAEDMPGELLRRADADSPWVRVCTAPCEQNVPLEGEYRIGSRAPFRLKAKPGETLLVRFDPGSTGNLVGGVVLIVLGSGVSLFGLVTTLFGAVIARPCSPGTSDAGLSFCGGGGGALAVGLLISGVGIAGIVGGIVGIQASRASVSQSMAFVRDPTWIGPTTATVPPIASRGGSLRFAF